MSTCAHTATHIVFKNGKCYVMCTHCGVTVKES